MPRKEAHVVDTRHCFEKHLDGIYRRTSRAWAFRGDSVEAFRRWQARVRRKVADALQLGAWQRPDLALKRRVQTETDEYRRERVWYQTLPGVTAPACLFIPRGVALPAPAVLCPPGHGGGMNQVVDETPGIYKQYPIELVRRGLVALVPEHLGFGERAGEANSNERSNHPYLYHALNLLGLSQLGLMIHDLTRALDLLQSLPEARPDRIGCCGLSLGGETTLLLSGLDLRVRVAVVSGFLCSYRSSFLAKAHCGCGYTFGLGRCMEHLDLASLIAPRPLLIESATRDPIFPITEARRLARDLGRVYALCGARRDLAQDVFDGEHEFSGAVASDWLVSRLTS
jgi:dienelactone hydrolase